VWINTNDTFIYGWVPLYHINLLGESNLVSIEFTNDSGMAFLTCMNYLFTSIQDLEAVTDEQKKKDMELEYYRSIAMMQSISDDQMKKMIDTLEELRLGLIREGKESAHDVSAIEVVVEPTGQVTA